MRKAPVRSLKVIVCADCGQPTMRLPPAVFCFDCKRARYLRAEKLRRVRLVTADPNFYRKQNAQKNAWRHAKTMAKGPVKCVVCGAGMPRIRGRRDSVALCHTDRVLHRRWKNQYDRVQRSRLLRPHRCIGCGTAVKRVKGLRAETARCVNCKREHKNELHRQQRARTRAPAGGEQRVA